MGKVQDLIFRALEDAGVKLEATQKKAVADELKDIPLVDSASALKEGQVAVEEGFYNSQREDLGKWKTKARKLEAELEEIKEATQSGESILKTQFVKVKQRIEELEPRYTNLMKTQRARWESESKRIPEKLKGKFKFADEKAKNGEGELSDDDILANLSRVTEYAELGVMGEPPKDTPNLMTGKTGGGTPPPGNEDWRTKSAKEQIAMGYKKTEAETK